jgi:hypothetical protein
MRRLALSLLLVGCGDAQELEPTPGVRTEAVIANSYASADATVRDGTYAIFPQGALTTLEVKTQRVGWNRASYLRFDITDMPASGGSATLYLYGTFLGSGEPVRARVCAVGDTTWTESTLTWNNRPAIDRAALAIALVTGEPHWYSLDLTNHVRAQKDLGATQVDLALQSDQYSDALASFSSREAAFNPPFLALSPENTNAAPTIVTPAYATTLVVDQNFTNLRALGADDNGEVNLTYTWQALGTPPAPVQYGNENGYNQGQSTWAYFSAAGTYDFRVTIADSQGLAVTSDTTVTVTQVHRSVTIEPQTATLHPGETLQLSAIARDQFENPLTPQPAIEWAADYNGSITPTGLYTAGSELGGPFLAIARYGHYAGGATITIVP